ncbi:MAG: class I SAM-dependent RNA methyltransferase [Bacteroidia bacterium]|nr:class I SAM-dependent RNA methyltransferase [Bacteroidia bacterium]
MEQENMKIIIRTFAGLEGVLAAEVLRLGGRNIKELVRAVQCEGDMGFVYKANFSLRTAINILVPIYEFKARDEDQFYKKLKEFAWDEIQDVDQTFVINPVLGNKAVFNHSLYLAQKTKDALADFFMEKYKKRPSVDKNRPAIYYSIHADDEKFSLALDSSGEILFKRGYRESALEAPLNEVLGAGLVMLSGWSLPRPLYNPMCGSGTIGIEAALMAANVPPGFFREEFAFQKWKKYDEALFDLISEKALERIKDDYIKVWCSDHSKKAVSITKENIESAKVEDLVEIGLEDFFKSEPKLGPGTVIINPPYSQRMELEDEMEFYKEIGNTLKRNYAGCRAWVLTANLDAAKFIGLKPTWKYTVYNGSLECRFLGFELYDGSKKAAKKGA